MKKILILSLLIFGSANAYQVIGSKELGSGSAKNQNITVKCTTVQGKVSNQSCSLRRYAKCSDENKCNGWRPWTDLREPDKEFSDWKSAANECCRAKGLR